MKIDEIKKIISDFSINNGKYCIVGSASLVIRGLKEKANDIDILITKDEYDKIDDILKNDKRIDFIVKDQIDIIIEWYEGYPLQTLDEMLSNKIRKNLEKDKDTIAILEKEILFREKNGEYVDLYDCKKNKLKEIVYRKKGTKSIVPANKYTIVVIALIKNSEGLYLIQKASKRKNGVYCLPGGHVKSNETSLDAIQNELFEEMKLKFDISNINLIKTYKYANSFRDIYMINSDINLNKIIIDKDEVDAVQLLSVKQIDDLINGNKFREHDLDVFYDIIKKV